MRRDFEEYLIVIQKQFTEMEKALNEANDLLKEGKLSEEAAMNIAKSYDIISSNYQRLLYCRYLYNLPPKFIQKLRKKKMDREAQKFIEEHADKDSVVEEGQEALDNIKEEAKDE